MKRAARDPARTRMSQVGRPCKPTKTLPTIRRKDLPVVHLPRQTRSQGGKTKLTNHRAAIILHAISSGCYRETAAELASVKAETLSHWMGWSGEPYETFQRLVRKAEAGLEVEDNDDVRAMVVEVLRMDPGITLFEAVNGSDAVDLAARERSQVVVTDIMMPRMDGLEATKRIKLAWPETKVIALLPLIHALTGTASPSAYR